MSGLKEFHGTFANRPRWRAKRCRHGEPGANDETPGWALKRSRLCFMCDATRERQTIPVCCPSLCSAPLQETGRNNCPELHPERKTHTRLSRRIYNTHSWAVVLLRLFLCAHWPDYCLFLSDGWVTSTGAVSTEHRSHLHHILLVTHRKSRSLDSSCQVTKALSQTTLKLKKKLFFRMPRILKAKKKVWGGDWGVDLRELLTLGNLFS